MLSQLTYSEEIISTFDNKSEENLSIFADICDGIVRNSKYKNSNLLEINLTDDSRNLRKYIYLNIFRIINYLIKSSNNSLVDITDIKNIFGVDNKIYRCATLKEINLSNDTLTDEDIDVVNQGMLNKRLYTDPAYNERLERIMESFEFYPLPKDKASILRNQHNCTPSSSTYVEPTFFNFTPNIYYLNAAETAGDNLSIISCRELCEFANLSDGSTALNLFVNFSDHTIGPKSLNHILLRLINTTIFPLVINKYSSSDLSNINSTINQLIKNFNNNRLNYDDLLVEIDNYFNLIANNSVDICIKRTVHGYNCDSRYVCRDTTSSCGVCNTYYNILDAFNVITNTRTSLYNPDRIFINESFIIFEIINEYFNYYFDQNGHVFNSTNQHGNIENSPLKINIVGVFIDTAVASNGNDFPGEYIIAKKFLEPELSYQLFEMWEATGPCKPEFYEREIRPPGSPPKLKNVPSSYTSVMYRIISSYKRRNRELSQNRYANIGGNNSNNEKLNDDISETIMSKNDPLFKLFFSFKNEDKYQRSNINKPQYIVNNKQSYNLSKNIEKQNPIQVLKNIIPNNFKIKDVDYDDSSQPIYAIAAGKRKSYRKKSHRRKSYRRKSYKRKSYKRKSYKK